MPHLAFGAPFLLLLTSIAVLVAALYVWVFARRRAAEIGFGGDASLYQRLRTPGFSSRRVVVKAALIVVAVALLGVAVARPQVGTHRTLLQREGTDVFIALDVSLSMTARDAAPTRLDRAKGALSALLDHLQGDRIGLVTFAGSAALRFPLTTDIESARAVINGVNYKDGGLDPGTSIATALRQASQGFANDSTRSKILVLVSDGEDLGDDAASAAQFVRSEGIVLDSITVGDTTAVPLYVVNPRTQKQEPRVDPATGQPLLTSADPKAMAQLAQDNHGHAYSGNTDAFAVQLADEIGRLQKTRFDSGEGDLPVERYQILVAIAAALLLLEQLLPSSRSARPARSVRARLRGFPAWRRRRVGGLAAGPTTGGD